MHCSEIKMTYKEIFLEMIKEHKIFLRIYLCVAAALSVFLFVNGNISYVLAAASMGTVLAASGSFGKIYGLCVQNLEINIDPPTSCAVISLLSILLQYIPDKVLTFFKVNPQLKDVSFGIMEYWPVRIFCFAWFVVSILRYFGFTRIGGLVIEDVSVKLGAIFQTVFLLSQLNILFANGNKVYAEEYGKVVAKSQLPGVVPGIFYVLLSFIILIIALICYIMIRYFIFFIDIITIPVCMSIPFASFGLEFLKGLVMVLVLVLGALSPIIFLIGFLILLIVSFLFFRVAYINVRYFKKIYVKPFFKKMIGYDAQIALLDPKTPGQIKKNYVGKRIFTMIPVYMLNKKAYGNQLILHNRYWMVIGEGFGTLELKKMFHKTESVPIQVNANEKIFIKKSLRFIEIFSQIYTADMSEKEFKKAPKGYHFVLSKEYVLRYEEIKHLTGFIECEDAIKILRQKDKLQKQEAKTARKRSFMKKWFKKEM